MKQHKTVSTDRWAFTHWTQLNSQISQALLQKITLKNIRTGDVGTLNLDASMDNYHSWDPVIAVKHQKENYYLTNLTIQSQSRSRMIFDGDSDYRLIQKSQGGMHLFDFGE